MPQEISRGQSLLALVILIGGIVFAVGIALALITAAFVNSTYGYQTSEQAEAVATAGAEDALLQITRNNQFSTSGSYSLPVGSSTATISVTQNSPSTGLDTVISQATAGLRIRKIQVVVSINPATGQSSIVSWNEVQ
jgi:hypothetical protein